MSSTRSAMRRKTPTKSFFTMVELIAVITITSILLTITINIMKTDSTKANAQVIGSSLNYAQAYALSELSSADDDGDGFADEYVMVIVDASEMKVMVKKFDSDDNTVDIILREEKLVGGSTIKNAAAIETDYLIGYRSKGDPITVLTVNHPSPVTDPPATITTLSSQANATIYVTDNKSTDVKQVVKVKPFTGKVTFY